MCRHVQCTARFWQRQEASSWHVISAVVNVFSKCSMHLLQGFLHVALLNLPKWQFQWTPPVNCNLSKEKSSDPCVNDCVSAMPSSGVSLHWHMRDQHDRQAIVKYVAASKAGGAAGRKFQESQSTLVGDFPFLSLSEPASAHFFCDLPLAALPQTTRESKRTQPNSTALEPCCSAWSGTRKQSYASPEHRSSSS